MIISLAGYMGSGKSQSAKFLNEKLNYTLIDLDHKIAETAGMSVQEIFCQNGELYFRKLERKALEDVLKSEENIILSLGGGTPSYYDNIGLIKEKSMSVFLRTSVGTLCERLSQNKEKRPLIANIEDEDLPEFISKHLFERLPYYSQCEYVVDTDRKTAEEVADDIIRLLPIRYLH